MSTVKWAEVVRNPMFLSVWRLKQKKYYIAVRVKKQNKKSVTQD